MGSETTMSPDWKATKREWRTLHQRAYRLLDVANRLMRSQPALSIEAFQEYRRASARAAVLRDQLQRAGMLPERRHAGATR